MKNSDDPKRVSLYVPSSRDRLYIAIRQFSVLDSDLTTWEAVQVL